MKILVAKRQDDVFETFFTKRVLSELEGLGELVVNPYTREFTKEELRDALEDVDVVFTGWGAYAFDEDILSKANKLKLIAHTGGSVAAIQDEALVKRNPIVLSGNKVYARSVAEGTICYMLVAQRKLTQYVEETKEQGWWKTYRFTGGLYGKTIGIVGFGMIAQAVAKLLQPFNVKIKINSSYLSAEEAAKYNAEVCSLEELCETCDIISLHSGLTKKNYHMINKELLGKMKDNALIVNTARGPIIDEAALADELKTGRISAILDVYEQEPLPMESPLRRLDNVILIPHQGGPTTDMREMVSLALIEDIKKWMAGETELDNRISFEYAKFMTDESLKKGANK